MAYRRRWGGMLLVIAFLGAACIVIPGIRRPILRAAGWALVVNDDVEPADVIVVAVDADGAGALEVADLVHKGIATRVAVFADASDDTVENEFTRRGVPYEGRVESSIRELRALGIDGAERIPGYVAGTENEGPALARWCNQNRWRSVIVISTSDHSRRLRRVLHRSMESLSTIVKVRYSRYSDFDPDQWWKSRRGTRTELEELEKLLLDIVRHPIS